MFPHRFNFSAEIFSDAKYLRIQQEPKLHTLIRGDGCTASIPEVRVKQGQTWLVKGQTRSSYQPVVTEAMSDKTRCRLPTAHLTAPLVRAARGVALAGPTAVVDAPGSTLLTPRRLTSAAV